jgi:hypothetical protein
VQAESDTVVGNGKRYNNRYHFYVLFRGNQIAQFREYNDSNHVREVLLFRHQLSTNERYHSEIRLDRQQR